MVLLKENVGLRNLPSGSETSKHELISRREFIQRAQARGHRNVQGRAARNGRPWDEFE